mgnify:CR=1 FL=1
MDRVPLLLGHLLDPGRRKYPRVAAEDVNSPMGVVGGPGHCLKVLPATHIGLEERGPATRLLDGVDSPGSALLIAPRTGEGWVKRQYLFSRFVADCARSAGFDAIRYGSTKDRNGVNYVILSPPEDLATLMRLDGVSQIACPDPAPRY